MGQGSIRLKLGRFLSADTIVPGYADPQNLNRYSYVGNSPLNYTDPTGHARIQDGPQQDKFKPSVANKYVPKPKPKPKKGNKGGGGGGGGGKDEGCKVLCDQTPNDPLLPQTPSQNDNPNIDPPDPNSSYCGDISGLACAAMLTQDVATLIDLVT